MRPPTTAPTTTTTTSPKRAEAAFADLARPVHGKQALLSRSTARPPRRPPGGPVPATTSSPATGPVFCLADYLEKHGRTARKHLCPPGSFWHAAHIHLTHPDDLKSLAMAAKSRHRLRWAHYLRHRAVDAGNTDALFWLGRMRRRTGTGRARTIGRPWKSAPTTRPTRSGSGRIQRTARGPKPSTGRPPTRTGPGRFAHSPLAWNRTPARRIQVLLPGPLVPTTPTGPSTCPPVPASRRTQWRSGLASRPPSDLHGERPHRRPRRRRTAASWLGQARHRLPWLATDLETVRLIEPPAAWPATWWPTSPTAAEGSPERAQRS